MPKTEPDRCSKCLTLIVTNNYDGMCAECYTMGDSECPFCHGEMEWCYTCDDWSSTCCQEYGTCECS